jgi:hypothetical protein
LNSVFSDSFVLASVESFYEYVNQIKPEYLVDILDINGAVDYFSVLLMGAELAASVE